jgi:hypothetical protein
MEGLVDPDPIVPPIVLFFKPGDKSWMRKGQDCIYDKRNISVVICDTDIFIKHSLPLKMFGQLIVDQLFTKFNLFKMIFIPETYLAY